MNSVILGILLVAFVIISVLLVLLVLVQDQESDGMGGMLGGGNSQTFGSHSASVLTKITVAFVILFFIATFAIAKGFSNKGDDTAAAMAATASEEQKTEQTAEATENTESAPSDNGKWWKKAEEAAPAETSPAEASN